MSGTNDTDSGASDDRAALIRDFVKARGEFDIGEVITYLIERHDVPLRGAATSARSEHTRWLKDRPVDRELEEAFKHLTEAAIDLGIDHELFVASQRTQYIGDEAYGWPVMYGWLSALKELEAIEDLVSVIRAAIEERVSEQRVHGGG